MLLLRLYLLGSAFLNLLMGCHGLMDAEALAAWRRSGDAIWGPEALRFHVAGHLMFAGVAVVLARAGLRSREDRAWFLGLLAFGAVLGASEGGAFSLPVVGLLLYAAVVHGERSADFKGA